MPSSLRHYELFYKQNLSVKLNKWRQAEREEKENFFSGASLRFRVGSSVHQHHSSSRAEPAPTSSCDKRASCFQTTWCRRESRRDKTSRKRKKKAIERWRKTFFLSGSICWHLWGNSKMCLTCVTRTQTVLSTLNTWCSWALSLVKQNRWGHPWWTFTNFLFTVLFLNYRLPSAIIVK